MYCICVQYLTAGCLSNFEIVCKFKVHVQEVESNTADALKGIMVISFIPLSSLGLFYCLCLVCIFLLIIVDVRANLHVPRLIPRTLKLTVG